MKALALKITLICAAVLALGVSARLEGAANTPERLQAFAKLPDWSGVWRLNGSPALIDRHVATAGLGGGSNPTREVRDHPPYNAEWETKYQKHLIMAEDQTRANAPVGEIDSNTRYCAAGWPRLFAAPFLMQFLVTPEETVILYSQREARHIYTDGRNHPGEDDLWPTFWGHSIGHWENDTLVVDTVAIKGGLWLDPTGATLSDSAHTVERIRMISPSLIEDQLVIDDPVALTKPWKLTRQYIRDTHKEIWFSDEECSENNRNPIVDGKVITVLPASASPCDDKCLLGIMDSYLTQLTRHDASPLRVAPNINARENGEDVKLGAGVWTLITKVFPGQTFADATLGGVVHIGAIEVAGKTGSIFVRLKVVERKITESEIISRGGEPGFNADASGMLEPDVLYDADVPAARRSTREQLAAVVQRYLDALSKHDGSLGSFSYRCDRYSAGSKFTNTGKPPETGGVTCESSLNNLKGQAVVNARISLIDPQRGLIVGSFIIPHGERNPPGATNVGELFKIVDGKIRSIEEFGFPGKFPPSSGFPDQ